jgi:hypothetical protein
MFTYEASVPTCARISISHNQHIPGLYEKHSSAQPQKSGIRGTDVQRPDYDSDCRLTQWDSLILQQMV